MWGKVGIAEKSIRALRQKLNPRTLSPSQIDGDNIVENLREDFFSFQG